VVHEIVNELGSEDLEPTLSAVSSMASSVDASSVESRRASLAEMIRVAANLHLEMAMASPGSTQGSLMAYLAAASPSQPDDRLVRSFQRVSTRLVQRYEAVYGSVLGLVGWRIKEGYSVHDVAFTLAALSEGIIIRMLIERSGPGIRRFPAPDGTSSVEWNLLGIAANSLVDAFAEPDPDWQP
jgi:hypothetical protein